MKISEEKLHRIILAELGSPMELRVKFYEDKYHKVTDLPLHLYLIEITTKIMQDLNIVKVNGMMKSWRSLKNIKKTVKTMRHEYL